MSREKVIAPGRRLGRKAIKTDTRTLRLARYLMPALPAPPAQRDWTQGVTDWGMMLNDTLGDCTIAGCGHAVQVWTLNTANEMTVGDDSILAAYEQWDGYNPADPSTDQGGVELDVLTDWRNANFAGHALTGFAAANVLNLTEIQQAIDLFGGVYIGVELPLTAQEQSEWDVVPEDGSGASAAGSWGGHCVYVPAYDQTTFTCISWGAPLTMTIAFWQTYVDEAYALFSPDWMGTGTAPSGFDQAQLAADLAAIC
jgi:hypothetical protein